jgi:PAS domain S-box-containing protein
VFVLSLAAVALAPEGSTIAVWWPAAGVAVAALLRAPRRWWAVIVPGVVVASALANYTAGRPPAAAVGFGLSNAAEAWLVAWWVCRGVTGRPVLRSLEDLWRLFSGVVLGCSVIAVGGGLTVHLFLDGDFWQTARSLMATHGAAIVVMAPLGMATNGAAFARRRGEAVGQWLITMGVVVLLFSPGQVLPVTFAPMPFLVWGALRLGPRNVCWQLLAVGVIGSVMTVHGNGPFAAVPESQVPDPETTGALVQLFLLAAAIITMPLALAVDQRRTALDRVSASEELFRRSFSESLVGMLVLRLTGSDLRIEQLNGTAAEILGGDTEELVGRSWTALLDTSSSVDEVARSMLAGASSGWREELWLSTSDRRRVQVSLSPLSPGTDVSPEAEGALFTAQMSDVTATYDANSRLRTEMDFTSAVLDTTDCLIIVVGLDGTVVGMNPAAERAARRSDSEVIGKPLWDVLVAPEERTATRQRFADRRALVQPHEGTLMTSAGSRRRVIWTSAYLTDETDTRTHVVMTGIDVTRERTAQRLLSDVVESATATPMIGTDLDGTVTVFNRGAEEMLQYTAEELLGAPLPDELLLPEEARARAAELGVEPGVGVLSAAVARTGEPETRDWTFVRQDGTRVLVNLTVSAVQDTFGQRVGYFGVGRDVTEQRRSQRALVATLAKEREAVERLRQLDQAKNEFVSTVSHELRTPITSIVGYTEMLQDGVAGELRPEQARLLDVVRRNGERLVTLVEDLLTLSSIESGTFATDLAEVDLRDVACQAYDAVRPLLSQRDLAVTLDVPEDPVVVHGDAGQLERVALNLLSNAVKFTEDGGRVSLSLRRSACDAMLVVRDTGIGIPVEEQPDLFTKFFRSSSAQERAIQGTGLGLSIVQSIVRNHGGYVSVDSAHLVGTAFTVRLPLDRGADVTVG